MRTEKILTENWFFTKNSAWQPGTGAGRGSFEEVTLPHCWNRIDGMTGVPFYRGTCWYVTSFEAPEQPLPGGKTYIEVGAAGNMAEIFVNGIFVKKHMGGFSIFRADVTECLKNGKNELAILVDNSENVNLNLQRADFTFYGGLYRYVKVISVPEIRFSLDYYGGPGVMIDAEPADGGAAVSARVFADGLKDRTTVRMEILDTDGNIVSSAAVKAEAEAVLKAFIPDAHLWEGKRNSYLYTARFQLIRHNEVLDQITERFGVRSFALSPERGFILNGKEHPLRGVCKHQDRLYAGNAVTAEMQREDMEIIADMGANCVRLAHYQHPQETYAACDELGLAVWAEIPYFVTDWNEEAQANSVNEIRELVVQNYNHPSVFFWGLSNEVFIGPRSEKTAAYHEELNRAVKELDSKRITVMAHEYSTPQDHPALNVPDAEGWNHYFGWYRGEAADLGKWYDEYHAAYPARCVGLTEYGCDAVVSYHSDHPQKNDYTEEYQAWLHEEALKTVSTRPFIWGTFVWNMFDFGSAHRREGGTLGRNNKGLVSMDRKIRKDAYYVYKAWLSDDPFVHIDGSRYFSRPGDSTTIRVHSNQRRVSLYTDGKLLAEADGEHCFIFENVPLSKNGTFITAKAGELQDTVTLYGGEEDPDRFVFPEFESVRNARNWFTESDDIAEETEMREGYFSGKDLLSDVYGNPEAKRVLELCLRGSVESITPPDLMETMDLKIRAEDTVTAGIMRYILPENKRPGVIRRINAELGKIKK